MSHPATFEDGLPVCDDKSGDPLQSPFTGLSLTDTLETRTGKKEFSHFNPVEKIIASESETALVRDNSGGINPFLRHFHTCDLGLKDLAGKVIPRHLDELQQPQPFTLHKNDALYVQGRQFQKKWGVSKEGFLNWKTLLSGWIDYPAIMLPNPSSWDHLQFDEMEKMSTTLSWLRKMLAQIQLGLDDVITFDMFPMLRNDLLDDVMEQMGLAKRNE